VRKVTAGVRVGQAAKTFSSDAVLHPICALSPEVTKSRVNKLRCEQFCLTDGTDGAMLVTA
jgi:hypothetical protein